MKIDLMQLEFIDKNLRTIVQEVENHFKVEFTITSLYRIDGGGVHNCLPLRGIDCRCKSDGFGMLVVHYVINNWCYDSRRPRKVCCIYHNAGNGYHLHFQTCSNTRRI